MKAEEFRGHFPIFSDGGVHLCSCSEGALSDRVTSALTDFVTSWRIQAAPWDSWMEQVNQARTAFAQTIHADPADIATVSCASEAAFQVSWGQSFSATRNVIITTDLEFPSIAHVWLAQQSRGAIVKFVANHDGLIMVDDYTPFIDDKTALVSVPLVSYANGLHFPVREIAKLAHKMGARVAVDAYQGVGVIPVDINELECDYLFAGTLKYLLGAPGIAFLWVKPGLSHANDPILTGWFGRQDPFAFTPRILDYAESSRRYQTGTPSIPAAFAATAGLFLINATTTTQVSQHIERLAEFTQAALKRQGWTFFSPNPPFRGPQVTIHADDAERISQFLADRRIFVSPRGQAVRVSLHYYNNEQDIHKLVQALHDYRQRYP